MSNVRFKKTKKFNNQSGFLLLELVVSIFLFSIVMTVSIGSLVLALDSNRKAQSLESVLNNLDIALDTMTKTLAVGVDYRCGDASPYTDASGNPRNLTQDCSITDGGDHSAISFLFNADLGTDHIANDIIEYKFTSDTMGGYISRTIYLDGSPIGTSPVRMTAPEVGIDPSISKFYVTGSTPLTNGDTEQPKVLIVINGKVSAGPRNPATDFTVQTAVTQRIPDFQ